MDRTNTVRLSAFDVGVMVLARPVTGIKVAKLAKPGFLEKNVAQGARMTIVGYGLAEMPPACFQDPGPAACFQDLERWDGFRRFGTSTMRDAYNTYWARFNRDPSGTCFGDSGGPTSF